MNRAFRLILFLLQTRWKMWGLKQKKIRPRWRICTDRFNPEFPSIFLCGFVWRMQTKRIDFVFFDHISSEAHFVRSNRHAISEFVSASANCQTRDDKTRERERERGLMPRVTDTVAQTIKSDDDPAIYADGNLRTDRWTRASSHHQCASLADQSTWILCPSISERVRYRDSENNSLDLVFTEISQTCTNIARYAHNYIEIYDSSRSLWNKIINLYPLISIWPISSLF